MPTCLLLSPGAGCRLLPRTCWTSAVRLHGTMADQPRQQVKRPRLSPRAAAADAAAGQEAKDGGSPHKQQPAQQQADQQAGQQSKQQQQRKPKAIVMPTPVRPPTVPTDPAAWENAVLLVDKPQVGAAGAAAAAAAAAAIQRATCAWRSCCQWLTERSWCAGAEVACCVRVRPMRPGPLLARVMQLQSSRR